MGEMHRRCELRVGIIGNRGHHEYVFSGLRQRQDVTLAAIASGTEEDDVQELLDRCRRAGHAPAVVDDWRGLLDQVDVACVVGPFEQHAAMCLEAFERGVHVFCEKPAAITLEELARLEQGYARANAGEGRVHFSAMMGLRYDPAFYSAWVLVQQGAVGSVRLLNAQKSYKLGLRPAYYARRDTYGGTIPWVGSHAIDWIWWFSGVRFERVAAWQSAQANRGNGELEVSALCLFQLEREIVASASIDYLRPEQARTHGDDRLRVVGEKGVIEVRGGVVYLVNDQAEGEQVPPLSCERQIFADFLAQVEGRGPALLSAEDVFIVTDACLRAQQAADAGREVAFRRQI